MKCHGRSLRRRYGRSTLAPSLRSMLVQLRGDGATHVEAGGGQRLIFRPGNGGKWEAAMVKKTSDGTWYVTRWEIAPFGGWRPDAAQPIDDAIRRAA